ncbi:MAG: HDOD domain-containing protein [Gammaproteobacteria bacterium]|nr:HDOD domain-containing protein [Gammaproteobacteria bacterium]
MFKFDELLDKSVQLFSLPEIYFKLRNAFDDPDSSLGDIVAVMKNDPAMTMRLLRLANSPFYGFASRIETVDRAINLLGIKEVENLALSVHIIEASMQIGLLNSELEKFWYDSVQVAIISRLMAGQCNVLDVERLFVAGLLHNIGHLALISQMPEETDYMSNVAKKQGIDLCLIEKNVLGYHYAQIGSELMSVWGLPESIRLIVKYHNEPQQAELYLLETHIVNLARAFVFAKDIAELLAGLSEEVKKNINLDTVALEQIYIDSQAQLNDVYTLLMPQARAA